MKNSRHCPRCQGSVFYKIETMTSPQYEYSNTFKPVGLVSAYRSRARVVAEIEAWVCQACGFTDLYAKDLELLGELAEAGEGVQVVDRATKQGPFR